MSKNPYAEKAKADAVACMNALDACPVCDSNGWYRSGNGQGIWARSERWRFPQGIPPVVTCDWCDETINGYELRSGNLNGVKKARRRFAKSEKAPDGFI